MKASIPSSGSVASIARLMTRALATALLAGLSCALILTALQRSGRQINGPDALLLLPGAQVASNERLLLQPKPDSGVLATLQSSATRSLKNDPLDILALHQLAAVASASGNSDLGDLLLPAEQVSRRDVLTQLALIELSVQRDDVRAALQHYDRLLLVHPQLQSVAYPALGKAIAGADVRSALVPFGGREWFGGFLVTLSRDNNKKREVMDLWRVTRVQLDQRAAVETRKNLLDAFTQSGDLDVLKILLAPHSRDMFLGTRFGFEADAIDPQNGRFSWTVHSIAGLQGELNTKNLRILVATAGRGIVAERTTLLSPGTYELSQTSKTLNDTQPEGEWRLSCERASIKVDLGRGPVQFNGQEVSRFVIPSDCPLQNWQLFVEAGAFSPSSEIEISDLNLRSL